MARPATPKIDRVLARLGPYPGAEPCWLWPGALTSSGYGNVSPGPEGGTGIVHRIVYEHMAEPVPEGLELDHLCRARSCANPAHLEPVPHVVNLGRGDHNHRRKTHCKNGHAFTPENTYTTPGRPGWRYCRECNRQAQRRHKEKTDARNPLMSARVFVWEVGQDDPSGLAPGKYCVWSWPGGEAELMFKPRGARTFLPAAQGQEER